MAPAVGARLWPFPARCELAFLACLPLGHALGPARALARGLGWTLGAMTDHVSDGRLELKLEGCQAA